MSASTLKIYVSDLIADLQPPNDTPAPIWRDRARGNTAVLADMVVDRLRNALAEATDE